MYITKEEFARMIRDGTVLGKTVITKNFAEKLPVTYVFKDFVDYGRTIKYGLTNLNEYDGAGPWIGADFHYGREEFADSLITENEFRENFEYIMVAGESISPDWEV